MSPRGRRPMQHPFVMPHHGRVLDAGLPGQKDLTKDLSPRGEVLGSVSEREDFFEPFGEQAGEHLGIGDRAGVGVDANVTRLAIRHQRDVRGRAQGRPERVEGLDGGHRPRTRRRRTRARCSQGGRRGVSIPPVTATGRRLRTPAMALEWDGALRARSASHSPWMTARRSAGSVMPTGSSKRIRVTWLPPSGSSSARTLIGIVTRSRATMRSAAGGSAGARPRCHRGTRR